MATTRKTVKAKPKQKVNVRTGDAGSKYDMTTSGAPSMSAKRARVKVGDSGTGIRGRMKDYGK